MSRLRAIAALGAGRLRVNGERIIGKNSQFIWVPDFDDIDKVNIENNGLRVTRYSQLSDGFLYDICFPTRESFVIGTNLTRKDILKLLFQERYDSGYVFYTKRIKWD